MYTLCLFPLHLSHILSFVGWYWSGRRQLQQIFPASRCLVVDARSLPMHSIVERRKGEDMWKFPSGSALYSGPTRAGGPNASLIRMESHFYKLSLRRLGTIFWLEAEPVDSSLGPDHAHRHLRPVRFGSAGEALRALDAADVGRWGSFPDDGVHATLSRSQLRSLGFRGNL